MKISSALNSIISPNKLLTIVLSILICYTLEGRVQRYSKSIIGSEVTVGATLVSQDELFPFPGYTSTWSDPIAAQQTRNYIRLRFDSLSTDFQACNFSVEVAFSISYRDAGNNIQTTSSTLYIEYNNDRGVTHKDQDYFLFSGGHYVDLVITSISPIYSGTCTGIPSNLRIDNIIEVERYFVFDATATGNLDNPPTYLSNSNELEVKWAAIAGAEEYQLEWLHINDYDGTVGGQRPATELEFNFRNNATRIDTRATSYRIPLIFEQGYIVFRYRGIGRQGPDYDIPVAGRWTIPDGSQSNPSSFDHYQILPAQTHEADAFNWQLTTNYAEGGKNKAAVSYFDGSMRNRQVVSRINSENQAIVGETIYDHQGRGTIQVLPTPTGGDSRLRYYDRYNRPDHTDSRGYDRTDFDLDDPDIDCGITAKPMGPSKVLTNSTQNETSTGSSRYYSPFNEDQSGHQAYVPDALQFPFAQMEYTPDNTGRIRRQGGVGVVHQLGTGKETKNFYGIPSQAHLNRLFGSEVGYFSHYRKNMVQDANGQLSVSYMDQQGRVIATGLAGQSPGNLLPINSNKQDDPERLTIDLLNNKDRLPGDEELRSTYVFLASTEGQYDFNYQITVEQFTKECLDNICYDCVYDLIITIKDECGNNVKTNCSDTEPMNTIRMTIGPFENDEILLDPACSDEVLIQKQFTACLEEVGNYTITKTLRVNEEALQYYLDDYLAREGCVIPLDDFISEEFLNTDFDLCKPIDGCVNICIEQLGADATAEEIEACRQECAFVNPCEAGYLAMQADFSPGGQYATFQEIPDSEEGNLAPRFEAGDQHSIFIPYDPDDTTIPPFISYNNPGIEYKDETGAAAIVTLLDGTTKTPNELSVTEFIFYFEASWAEALVSFHPEFCHYRFCSEIMQESDRYDHLIQTTESYEEALNLGLLNPLNLAYPSQSPVSTGTLDPYFVSGGPASNYSGSSQYAELRNYMLTHYVIQDDDYNLWEIAAATVICNDPDVDNPEVCVVGIPGTVTFDPFSSEETPCFQDRIWKIFRGLYLGKKRQLIEQLKADMLANITNFSVYCRDIPGLKQERFPSYGGVMDDFGVANVFDGVYNDPGTLGDETSEVATDELAELCATQCESYADNWLQRLSGCYNGNSEDWQIGEPMYDALREKLIAICIQGCSLENPMGATSIQAGADPVPSDILGGPDSYASFEEAIAEIVPHYGGGLSVNCNADLITDPKPYGHSNSSLTVSGNLDDCACDKLLEVDRQYNAYVAGSGLPPGIETLQDLFVAQYGLTVDEIEQKICLCERAFPKGRDDELNWFPDATWTPEALSFLTTSGEVVPAALGCSDCASCYSVQRTFTAYLENIEGAYYGGSSIPEDDLPLVYIMATTHLNDELGLDLTWVDYEAFLAECQSALESDLYCGELTIEALDLERLLILLTHPSTRPFNNGQQELLSNACLCADPYSQLPANPAIPDLTASRPFIQSPPHPYSNSLVDNVDSNFDYTILECDHLYEFQSINNGTLTGTISSESDPGINCTLNLSFVDTEAAYEFEHIQYFQNIQADPDHLSLGLNYHFLIEAVVALSGGQLVTTTMQGVTDCFPIVECFSSKDGPHLCTPQPSTEQEEDACTEALINQALTNAQSAYTTYIEAIKTEFRAAYIEKCLSAAEKFDMSYWDNEHHYTLYYYGQDGNLERTVPPAGVELINNQEYKQAINTDRDNDDRNIFTRHRMATTYQYNSLNQLVSQSMPDHDDQMNWQLQLPTLTPTNPGLIVRDIQFTSDSHGFLIADDPTQAGKSLISQTTDGGHNWETVNNIKLGDLNAVQFLTPQLGYAVGNDGTMVMTEDGGVSWCLIATGTAGDLVDFFFNSSTTAGILISRNGETRVTTNAGETWTAGPVLPLTEVSKAHFSDDDHGYIVGKQTLTTGEAIGAIFRTTDGGQSWQQQVDIQQVDLTAVQFLNSETGYIVGQEGTLLKTSDSGSTWVELPVRLNQSVAAEDLKMLHFSSENEGVVLTQSGNLYHTGDGGDNWSVPVGAPSLVQSIYFINAAEGILVTADGTTKTTSDGGMNWGNSITASILNPNSIMLVSANEEGIIAGNAGTLRLKNEGDDSWGGAFFQPISGAPDIQEIHLFNGFSEIYARAEGKVYRFKTGTWINGTPTGFANISDMFFLPSTDKAWILSEAGQVASRNANGIWTSIGVINPPTGIKMKSLFFLDPNTGWAIGEKGSIYTTSDGGSTWSVVPLSNMAVPSLHGVFALSNNNAFAVGQDGTILKTNDAGALWEVLASGSDIDLNTIGFYDNASGYAGGIAGSILRTTNAGDSWTASTTSTADIQALAIANNDLAYWVGTAGSAQRQITVGGTWNNSNTGLGSSLNDIAATSSNPTLYAVGDEGHILKTTDAANTWEDLPLSIQAEQLLATHFPNPDHGYAVGRDGIMIKTTDGGVSWVPVATGVHEQLNSVHFTDSQKGVAVGDNGTFRYTINGGEDWTAATLIGGAFSTIDFQDVTFNEAGTVGYAVGSGGTILRSSDLVNWAIIPAPAGINEQLNAVVLLAYAGYIAGEDGVLLKSFDFLNPLVEWTELKADNGERWPEFNTGNSSNDDLYNLHFIDFETGYAVGQAGLLLKTTNGGESWTLRDAATTEPIYALHFLSPRQGFLGGGNAYMSQFDDGTDQLSTRFWYDFLGRLVASQNPRQYVRSPQRYSYTRYDALGRIVEVGELESDDGPEAFLNAENYPNNWSTTRFEVTRTLYDRGIPDANLQSQFGSLGQQRLRTRVASSLYYETYDGSGHYDYENASHYSYDIHGNVKQLLQENRDLAHLGQQYKLLEYDYDLVSGNVNALKYQAGQCDQFFHRYHYDADNRLDTVWTSTDGVQWDRDAVYDYYQHGPLARTELGDQRVQGIDYAYTLQGWIKGINSNSLDPEKDIGKDGISLDDTHGRVARDVAAYSLAYYKEDYQEIGGTTANSFLANINGTPIQAWGNDLYNGNIRHMVTSLTDLQGNPLQVQGTAYKYDQLNRLKEMTTFSAPNIANTNNFAGAAAVTDYHSEYDYDPNGNIMRLYRNGGGQGNPKAMDQMSYNYAVHGGKVRHNRLLHVNDRVPATFYPSTNAPETYDIDDQGTFDLSDPGSWNYHYDETGNLISDQQEQIERIEWTAMGKVKRIIRTNENHDKADLEFAYDASGNRVMKLVKPRFAGVLSAANHWKWTYYVRDPSGNTLVTYQREYGSQPFPPNSVKENLFVKEYHLYGSSRLGIERNDKLISQRHFVQTGLDADGFYIEGSEISGISNCVPMEPQRMLGQKSYELANHLGNVLATVSDRRIVKENNGNILWFEGEVKNFSDYYPFGVRMSGREGDQKGYRYGFNGMEKDNEVKGSGNSLDFGARIYDPRLGRWLIVDPHTSSYPSLSGYSAFANNPINVIDPDGRDIIPVHGTWSNINTWGDLRGIRKASNNLFGDNNLGVSFPWSGANYAQLRTKAAIQLVDHVRTQMQSEDFNGEITLVGHSHGGNVSIEALNMMAEMEEFDNVQLNLLTINTPVREDYQLSEKATGRVSHTNVYDPKDPVQSRGGNSSVVLPDLPRTPDFMDANTKGTGEYGPAGRTFRNANNIKVDNPQGLTNGWKIWGRLPIPKAGDYHNSHNRVDDWINKTEEK